MRILGSELVTLRRFAAGSYVNGFWVAGSSVDSTIQMSFQPLNDADREELSDLGLRERVSRKGYTETELHTVNQHDGGSPDRIVVDSIVYSCMGAARQRSVRPHYKVWLSRLDEGAT